MVWTENEAVTVDVPFNQEWFSQQYSRLKEFYFMNLLPAITDAVNSQTLRFVKLAKYIAVFMLFHDNL